MRKPSKPLLHKVNSVGETLWEVTDLKLPPGEEGERIKQIIRADKREILRREYWRCPQCNAKVDADIGECQRCKTPMPSSTLLDDKEQIEKLACRSKRHIEIHYKGTPAGNLGDLSIRELYMHCGILVSEIKELKKKGLLD